MNRLKPCSTGIMLLFLLPCEHGTILFRKKTPVDRMPITTGRMIEVSISQIILLDQTMDVYLVLDTISFIQLPVSLVKSHRLVGAGMRRGQRRHLPLNLLLFTLAQMRQLFRAGKAIYLKLIVSLLCLSS